jgi:hypothetical protein
MRKADHSNYLTSSRSLHACQGNPTFSSLGSIFWNEGDFMTKKETGKGEKKSARKIITKTTHMGKGLLASKHHVFEQQNLAIF